MYSQPPDAATPKTQPSPPNRRVAANPATIPVRPARSALTAIAIIRAAARNVRDQARLVLAPKTTTANSGGRTASTTSSAAAIAPRLDTRHRSNPAPAVSNSRSSWNRPAPNRQDRRAPIPIHPAAVIDTADQRHRVARRRSVAPNLRRSGHGAPRDGATSEKAVAELAPDRANKASTVRYGLR